jgi:hypothetical protein
MLAIITMGMGDVEGPVLMTAPCNVLAERYHAPAATASKGTPTESLKPRLEAGLSDICPTIGDNFKP